MGTGASYKNSKCAHHYRPVLTSNDVYIAVKDMSIHHTACMKGESEEEATQLQNDQGFTFNLHLMCNPCLWLTKRAMDLVNLDSFTSKISRYCGVLGADFDDICQKAQELAEAVVRMAK